MHKQKSEFYICALSARTQDGEVDRNHTQSLLGMSDECNFSRDQKGYIILIRTQITSSFFIFFEMVHEHDKDVLPVCMCVCCESPSLLESVRSLSSSALCLRMTAVASCFNEIPSSSL